MQRLKNWHELVYHIAGPGSPSVLTNMIYAIEQHVDWIADAITKMDKEGIKAIVASKEAENGWVGHVNDVADATLLKGCNSWYLVSRHNHVTVMMTCQSHAFLIDRGPMCQASRECLCHC